MKSEGEKDGIICHNEECRERRGNCSICHRNNDDPSTLFHPWSFSVDPWAHRGSVRPYCDIRILTLKRIYAEGLQQGREKGRE